MPGDDLVDDFVPDDLVALSSDDQHSDLADEDAFFSSEEYGGPVEQSTTTSVTQEEGASSEKKRKRREKEKEKKRKRKKTTEAEEQKCVSIAAQSPGELQDYLSSLQAKAFPHMSPIELKDMEIPASSIADTTLWAGPRTLDQLPDFIAKVLPSLRTRLAQRSKDNAAPTLLFLTSAALRVADVTRVLKTKQLRGEKGGDVAKLFAKHIKFSEHVSYLKRTKIGAAAGTPGRVGKLLCETDALSVSALSHIIFDASFKDAKKRCLFDIAETRDEVFKLVLGCDKVLKAIKKGQVQVVLF